MILSIGERLNEGAATEGGGRSWRIQGFVSFRVVSFFVPSCFCGFFLCLFEQGKKEGGWLYGSGRLFHALV